MTHKGCYFSENSMNPQCHALWNRMEKAEACCERLEAERDSYREYADRRHAVEAERDFQSRRADALEADCAAKDAALEKMLAITLSMINGYISPHKLEEAETAAKDALSNNPSAALLAERDRLREALESIGTGSFSGASNFAIAEDWHGFAQKFQTIARQALANLDGQKEPNNG